MLYRYIHHEDIHSWELAHVKWLLSKYLLTEDIWLQILLKVYDSRVNISVCTSQEFLASFLASAWHISTEKSCRCSKSTMPKKESQLGPEQYYRVQYTCLAHNSLSFYPHNMVPCAPQEGIRSAIRCGLKNKTNQAISFSPF